jgi:hypothetical protein
MVFSHLETPGGKDCWKNYERKCKKSEAVRIPRRPEVLGETLQGLVASVEGLENTHPRLVAAVNRIALTLSGMGI